MLMTMKKGKSVVLSGGVFLFNSGAVWQLLTYER